MIRKGRLYSVEPTRTGFEIITRVKYGGEKKVCKVDWVRSGVLIAMVNMIETFAELIETEKKLKPKEKKDADRV